MLIEHTNFVPPERSLNGGVEAGFAAADCIAAKAETEGETEMLAGTD